MLKYITRWRDKGGVEDLRKAKHFLDFLIEHEMKKKSAVEEAFLVSFPEIEKSTT